MFIQLNWSSNGLWYCFNIKDRTKRYSLAGLSIIEHDNLKALELVIGKLQILLNISFFSN